MTDEVDPIIAEIRAIRDKHAARFGYDVDAIFDYYQGLQGAFGRRSMKGPDLQPEDQATLMSNRQHSARKPRRYGP